MSDKKPDLRIIEGNRQKALEEFLAYADLQLSEDEVNELDISHQRRILHDSSYRQKFQLIQKSDHSTTLIRSLKPADLFLTMDAAGWPDGAALILHSTPTQMTRIFDFDCWEQNDFQPEKQLAWLLFMLEADRDKLVTKVRTMEYEQLLMFFSNFIRVKSMDWSELDQAKKEDFEYKLLSVDEEFQFELTDPDMLHLDEFLELLRHLHKFNFELYRKIMEGLIWESPSNLEEYNLRSRADRMADEGFPEYLEALGLFAPLNTQAMRTKLSQKAEDLPHKEKLDRIQKLPTVFRRVFKYESFFKNVLENQLEPQLRERIYYELSALGNRMMVARSSFKHIEEAEKTLKQMHNYLDIGLEFLSDGQEEQAGRIIAVTPLMDIFRAAYSLAMQLHSKTLQFINKYCPEGNVAALDLVSSPTIELMMSLTKLPPLYYEGVHGIREEYREFQKLEEIERSAVLIDRTAFLFSLHFDKLALDLCEIASGDYSFEVEGGEADLHFVKLFLTTFANSVLCDQAEYKPLSKENFVTLLDEWLQDAGTGFDINPQIAQKAEDWIAGYCKEESDEYKQLAKSWAERCIMVLDHLAAQLEDKTRSHAIALSRVLLLD